MSIILQLNLIGALLLVLIYIFYMVKKNKLQLKFSLIWIVSIFILILFSLFPVILMNIAKMLGIEVASNAIYLLTIAFLYLICCSMTIAISHSSSQIKRMAQEIALLRSELEAIKKAGEPREGTAICPDSDESGMK